MQDAQDSNLGCLLRLEKNVVVVVVVVLVAQETVDSFTSCHWALFIVGGCPVFEASVQFGCNGIGSFNNAKEAPTSPEAVPEPGAKALQWIRTYLRCFTYLLFDVVCTSKGQPTKPLPFVNVRNLLS